MINSREIEIAKREIHPFSFLAGTSLDSVVPTARIIDCGGLIMAAKFLIPNMPKLDTVIVPPWNSCGFSFPSLAFAANSFTSLLICTNPFPSALNTIGVIKPVSTLTATLTSTLLYLKEET